MQTDTINPVYPDLVALIVDIVRLPPTQTRDVATAAEVSGERVVCERAGAGGEPYAWSGRGRGAVHSPRDGSNLRKFARVGSIDSLRPREYIHRCMMRGRSGWCVDGGV